jgi:aromatic-L-amino-acid decarboxylase
MAARRRSRIGVAVRLTTAHIAPDPGCTIAPMEEHALINELATTLQELLPALDEFIAYEGPDTAADLESWMPHLDRTLPATGRGATPVLAALRDVVIRHGLRNGHPGFSGWVTTSPTTIGVAAHLSQTVAASQRWWIHPGNHIDSLAADWMLQLLGFPESFGGVFTSGGSTANLVGLGAARQHAGERLGIDLAMEGASALPEPRVYASANVHHVVGRSMGVLGLGRQNLRSIPIDEEHRLDMAKLREALAEDLRSGATPVAIVGNGGDVNLGVVDPLPAMAELAHEHDVWFHVDGAYGGFGMLDERVAPLFGDPAEYDSFAVDPHKWMAAPVGTGYAAFRDGDLVARAFRVEPGEYDKERDHPPVPDDPRSPWESTGRGTPDWGVDFSAPARGVAVWAILEEIGAEGMTARVRRHIDCAHEVARLAHASEDLEVLSEPVLSICCFRFNPAGAEDVDLDAINTRILDELRAAGRTMPSATIVEGHFALRPCFINPRTEIEHARALVAEVLEIGHRLTV